MSIISWIILGLTAGFIGGKIVNAEGQGFWLNIALGIIGALVGGFLFNFFGATGIYPQWPAPYVGGVVSTEVKTGGGICRGVIPNPIDQNRWAHWRNPMDMMRQG